MIVFVAKVGLGVCRFGKSLRQQLCFLYQKRHGQTEGNKRLFVLISAHFASQLPAVVHVVEAVMPDNRMPFCIRTRLGICTNLCVALRLPCYAVMQTICNSRTVKHKG